MKNYSHPVFGQLAEQYSVWHGLNIMPGRRVTGWGGMNPRVREAFLILSAADARKSSTGSPPINTGSPQTHADRVQSVKDAQAKRSASQ